VIERARSYLIAAFPARNVDSLLKHYRNMSADLQVGRWEDCTSKAGKFVEASLKAICAAAQVSVPSGRAFKVDTAINKLASRPAGSCDESLRVTLPRASRFVYEIASNRGARHDPDEVDPNEMDAIAVLEACSWMCAEMIRVASKGAADLPEVRTIVASLAEKRYPLIEEVDGRVWFHNRSATPRDKALVLLNRVHPGRMPRKDLLASLRRHGVGTSNASVVLSRLKGDGFVDENEHGGLFLLSPGRQRAEEVQRSPTEE
jgi:hypothetical protein